MQSQKYQLNKEDGLAILKVLGWTLASALVSGLIIVVANLEVPAEYMFLIPIVNTILYSVQKFLADR